jgi:hypothetical protein
MQGHQEQTMSRQLAISSALSVLLMSAFVLLGPQASRDPLPSLAQAQAIQATTSAQGG